MTHGNSPVSAREDFDHDGRWDTWFDATESTLSFDTDDDGEADLYLPASDSIAASDEAVKIRGF